MIRAARVTTSTFGAGRVAVWGDSSPIDDGTGQAGNTLFDGWSDPAGTDAALALNATAWLAGTGTTTPPPPGGTCPSPGQKLGNTGFETGTAAPWTATASVVTSSASEPAHAGSWEGLARRLRHHPHRHARADRLRAGRVHRDAVVLAARGHGRDDHHDRVRQAHRDRRGATLATCSNLDRGTGFIQRTLAVPAATSVTVTFRGVERALSCRPRSWSTT